MVEESPQPAADRRTHGARGRVALISTLVAVAAIAVTVLAGSALRDEVGHTAARLATRFAPPSQGEESGGAIDPRAARRLLQGATAHVLWSSNRGGQHDLYEMMLPSGEVRRLTDHPHVEFLSRYSPDGTMIVFLRSQREWVSFREHDAWDVWVMSADGGNERRVARGGYHATWSADGRIVYQRGQEVVRVDVDGGNEEVLFALHEGFAGHGFADIELSADGTRLAMDINDFGAGVVDLATREMTPLTRGTACQTTWAPNDAFVLWMEAEGHGGTQIMRGLPDGSGREVFMDMPGEFSHEYFPRVSADGAWLAFAASAGGHEHDRADYEIFLWKIGTVRKKALRLTHHTGNDQWPDVRITR